MSEKQKSEKTLAKAIINRWKIGLAILIGLSIAGWLLFNALSDVRFVKTLQGEGEYVWTDSNNNNIVDFDNEEDFKKTSDGNYSKETFSESWSSLNISFNLVIFLLLALVMMGLRDLGYMMRIRILTGNQLSWKQSFRVIMIWEFASAITPGIVGGAAVAMFILKKEGINMGKSTAIVLITALLDEIFYIFIVPVTILVVGAEAFFPLGITSNLFGVAFDPFSLFFIGFGVICLLVLFLLIAIFISPYWIKRSLMFFCRLFFLKRLMAKAEKTGEEIIIASKEFKGMPAFFWMKAFGATFLSWMGRFMVINCLILAFSPLADQLMVFARQLSMWVILLISPTPGGSGIAEFVFSGFLRDFIPFGLVAVLAILWRLISYYPYLFIGAVIIPKWLRNNP